MERKRPNQSNLFLGRDDSIHGSLRSDACTITEQIRLIRPFLLNS